MLLKEYETGIVKDTPFAFENITLLSPGDDDDVEDGDGDWSDVDDEDFEDMAEDRDDLHEMQIENDIFDEEDADHLPEDDD